MIVREDYVNQYAIAGWIRDLALLAHDRRMRAVPLDRAASGTGMETKAQHSPVDKWSLAVKLRPDGDGEQREFRRWFASNLTGREGYVAWRRKA